MFRVNSLRFHNWNSYINFTRNLTCEPCSLDRANFHQLFSRGKGQNVQTSGRGFEVTVIGAFHGEVVKVGISR